MKRRCKCASSCSVYPMNVQDWTLIAVTVVDYIYWNVSRNISQNLVHVLQDQNVLSKTIYSFTIIYGT